MHLSAHRPSLTIIISSAGRRVELINCFRQSAEFLNCDLTVVATDARPEWSAACQHANKSFTVPRCDDPAFVSAMMEICQRENVSLLVPTIDHELQLLAAASADFERIGTQVAVSDPAVIALARNKYDSNRFFRSIGLNAPKTALLRDAFSEPLAWKFPLVAKPIDGSSSIGFQLVPSEHALRCLAVDPDSYIVQDRVHGREYTVNLFFDRSGLRCQVHHQRVEIRSGEVSKGITERVPALSDAADRIGQELRGKAFGALNFQAVIPESGIPEILEMNARFSGGYPLVHRAGAKFAQWLLEPLLQQPCTADNSWSEGVAMLRYDAAFFVTGEE